MTITYNMRKAAEQIKSVAFNLKSQGHKDADELIRVAQVYGLLPVVAGNLGPDANVSVVDGKDSDFDPAADEGTNLNGDPGVTAPFKKKKPLMQDDGMEDETQDETQDGGEELGDDLTEEDPEMSTDMSPEQSPNINDDVDSLEGDDKPLDQGGDKPLDPGMSNDMQSPQVPGNFSTHTCSVTFKAGDQVDESDMMDFIMSISQKLPVKVEGFKWNVQDPKPVAASWGWYRSMRKAQFAPSPAPMQGGNQGIDPSMNFDPASMDMGVQDMGMMGMPDQGTNLSGGMGEIEPFSAHKGHHSPEEGMDSGGNSHKGLHPGIDSFVKVPEESQDLGVEPATHTCSVTFKAKEDVDESQMMNYILKISENLPVKVEGFRWNVQEAKPSK